MNRHLKQSDMTRAEAIAWLIGQAEALRNAGVAEFAGDQTTFDDIAAMLERDGRKADAFDAIAEGLTISHWKSDSFEVWGPEVIAGEGFTVIEANQDHPDKPSALLSAVEQALRGDHE